MQDTPRTSIHAKSPTCNCNCPYRQPLRALATEGAYGLNAILSATSSGFWGPVLRRGRSCGGAQLGASTHYTSDTPIDSESPTVWSHGEIHGGPRPQHQTPTTSALANSMPTLPTSDVDMSIPFRRETLFF
mmetsp:Transcript_39225/g.104116  ORF Transcript_39225/g.104116 Transcript_39225/m.104116 type:complete len:131 (+) Transcript_39225:172-564(+)